MDENNNVVIGLFGTCGGSKWRDQFIEKYNEQGIAYFNPQVDNWTEELATVEAHHLAHDKIILFPVTSETYGQGSLSEVGFSIIHALKLDNRRSLIVLIEQKLDDHLNDSERRKDSLRSRALIREHLKKLNYDNVYIVETFDQMLEASIVAYEMAKLGSMISKYNANKNV